MILLSACSNGSQLQSTTPFVQQPTVGSQPAPSIYPNGIVATVPLGTAAGFAVLAASTVTNSGPTVINGDLGLDPGTAVTGFPPGTVVGTIYAADAKALKAQNDLTTAYNNAAGRSGAIAIPADIGGLLIKPGVYRAPVSLAITGSVTLDGQHNPNSVFIFQIPSTLTTATNSSVRLINGANQCNIFWQVGSSATLKTTSVFVGTILAQASISLGTGTTVRGRLLARTGAVTLLSNIVHIGRCAVCNAVPSPRGKQKVH
jgi:hypothetical protein